MVTSSGRSGAAILALLLVTADGVRGDPPQGSIIAWGCSYGFGLCNVPAPNTGFVAVAAGGNYSLGLKPDGSMVAWGDNAYGQTNVPPPNTSFIVISAGWFHSLGLKADGSIVAWGYNDLGQTNIPAPNTGFVGVGGGVFHSLGLKTDGSIVAWGLNSHGETNVPLPNSGFMAITAGYLHSLGLKSDGSIVAWGYNDLGQTNVPAPNTDFVSIAAGGGNSFGIRRESVGSCCDTNGADQGCTDDVTEAMCTGPDKVWTNQGQCADQECGCIPDCNGATCGDDGCGGSCGTCDTCETIGGLSVTFQFSDRFRGNLYHIVENDVFLREVKMQLAFAGTANFWVSVHKKQLDGSFQEVDINGGSPTQGYIFLGNAQGLGANTAVFYTTGAINNGLGVELTPGDYAIGFAWGPESIKYGRDSSTYPKPLNEGSTLASVSRDVFAGEPPLPSTLPSLTEFTGGAYSMQLCFVPLGGGGACCDTNGADQGCTDNVTEAMCTGPDKVWTNQGQCADQECNCILDCNGATCGDDGCGGSCGTCDDGNPCNGVETCNANRTCVAGTPLNCNDGNVCNGVDTCDPASGCRPGQPLLCDNGVACDGQETCNPSSGCVAGIPVNCDDGLDCTVDSCTEPNGSCTHDDADCSIPTVSEWGLVVLALLLLIGAKVYFGRQAIA